MKDKVLEKIENAKNYEDLLENEIIDNIYKCNPIDKAYLMKSITDKVSNFGKEEKKLVILYQEDTKKYRKRCPYCNTYLTSGNTICEVCGSEVSA